MVARASAMIVSEPASPNSKAGLRWDLIESSSAPPTIVSFGPTEMRVSLSAWPNIKLPPRVAVLTKSAPAPAKIVSGPSPGRFKSIELGLSSNVVITASLLYLIGHRWCDYRHCLEHRMFGCRCSLTCLPAASLA